MSRAPALVDARSHFTLLAGASKAKPVLRAPCIGTLGQAKRRLRQIIRELKIELKGGDKLTIWNDDLEQVAAYTFVGTDGWL